MSTLQLHATAARVVEQCLSNQKNLSIRRIVEGVCQAATDKERKAVFAIVCQVLKYKEPVSTIIANSGINPSALKGKKSSIYLVLIYELLFGKGFKSAPSQLRNLVIPHKTRLTAELAKLKIKKRAVKNEDLIPEHIRNAVVLPRFARVNTLVTTMDQCLKDLAKNGYELMEYEDGMDLSKLRPKTMVKDPHIPSLLVLPPNSDFHNHELLLKGHIILQDKASCFPAFILNPPKNATVIDGCAAPGNKTSHLSMMMNNTGTIHAFDKDSARLQTLIKLTGRSGCKNITPKRMSFLDVDPNDKMYAGVEYILLDPSCSGSGITRRLDHLLIQSDTATAEEEELDENGGIVSGEARIKALADFQVEVLMHAFKFKKVKKVAYSTCSKHREENEGVVERVLALQSDFKLVKNVFPEWKRRGVDGFEEVIRTLPEEDNCIGFFVALFERKKHYANVNHPHSLTNDVLHPPDSDGILPRKQSKIHAKMEEYIGQISNPPSSLSPPASPIVLNEKLSEILVDFPDVSLSSKLFGKLQELESITHLDKAFDEAGELIDNGMNGQDSSLEGALMLKRTSEFGIFIRRLVLDYNTFNFVEISRFFDSVVEWKETLLSPSPDTTLEATNTILDADSYLNNQLMMKDGVNVNGETVLKSVEGILNDIPESVKGYYVQYQLALRTGDFDTALHKLHQFFDYSAVHSKKSMRQYAPLHLAHLHVHFGNLNQASAMLQESMSSARLAKDQECLNHCLSLMHKLTLLNPSPKESTDASMSLLDSLVKSAALHKMPGVQQEAELGLTETLISRQDKNSPGAVFESLKRARMVGIPTAGEDAGESSGTGNAVDVLSARVWDMYGVSTVADLHSRFVEGLDDNRSKDVESLEGLVEGLAMKAEKEFFNGNIPASKILLEGAKNLANESNVVLSRPWQYVASKIEFCLALNRGRNFEEVERKLGIVKSFSEYSITFDLEAKFLEAQMLKQFGETNTAIQMVNTLIHSAESLQRESLCIQYQLFLADCHLSLDSPKAALPHIQIALTTSQSFSQHQHTRKAYVSLSRYFLKVRKNEMALRVLEKVLGSVSVNGDAIERGVLQETHAECLWGVLTEDESKGSVTSVLQQFEASCKAFESVESWRDAQRAMFKKARFLDFVGGQEYRDEWEHAVKRFQRCGKMNASPVVPSTSRQTSEASLDSSHCSNCFVANPSLAKCGRCMKVQYCSQTCQFAAWKSHKLVCGDSDILSELDSLAPPHKSAKLERRYKEVAEKELELFHKMYPTTSAQGPFESYVFPELFCGSDVSLCFGEEKGIRFREYRKQCEKDSRIRKDSVWSAWVKETEARLRIEVAHLIAKEKERERASKTNTRA
ncbi:putative 28S rRNA (cytosine-C(5))-methyltransferase [Rhizoclosmatium sp. JEL0117]|nr:putative 28S rRNA (cytosine-C(5))-methyltransferase [Rhizoclosmatium sp. JEL0117]